MTPIKLVSSIVDECECFLPVLSVDVVRHLALSRVFAWIEAQDDSIAAESILASASAAARLINAHYDGDLTKP